MLTYQVMMMMMMYERRLYDDVLHNHFSLFHSFPLQVFVQQYVLVPIIDEEKEKTNRWWRIVDCNSTATIN